MLFSSKDYEMDIPKAQEQLHKPGDLQIGVFKASDIDNGAFLVLN